MRERTDLAMAWLREIRAQLAQILRLHRLIARYSRDLDVGVELRLAAGFLLLRGMLGISAAIIRVAGPFRLRALSNSAMTLLESLADSVGESIQSLDTDRKAALRADWTRGTSVAS